MLLRESEQWVFELYAGHQFGEAYAHLHALLAQKEASIQAAARYLLAVGLYLQSTQHLRKCVELTREALDQSVGNAELQIKCLINGLIYARLASDADTCGLYVLRVKALLMTPSNGTGKWVGRCLNNLGSHYQALGDSTKAMAYLAESVQWHRRNQGPWNERDRQCYLGRGLIGLAEERLKAGDVRRAKVDLEEARPLLVSRSEMLWNVEGLMALRAGELDTARERFTSALELAREHGEQDLAAKLVENISHVYIARKDAKALQQFLRPIITDYAKGRMVSQVIKLQRLMHSVPSGEGMVS